ncbi:D-amino-acid oxidase [Mycena rosella]|uniref:D-amino-acid oxidase n=1 Tax=Mycena rosella TaxID=1033263 RepID=A0AAD7DSI8_MYCRO|nr:D-amino-acid oxidase [Mycena rosella]
MERMNVFVVGAGVVGLSTAIRALEAGYNVTIFAEIFPGDPKSIKYTSCWAGADHISVVTSSTFMHELERETMQAFLHLIEVDPLVPVMLRPHVELTQAAGPDIKKKYDHLSQFYSDFRSLRQSELPEGVVAGVMFPTIHVDVPRYLPYLMNRFLHAGGQAFRMTIPSLSSLIARNDRPVLEAFPLSAGSPPSSDPAAVINCTGLGALSLGDVLDTDVYPTRGETLLIRAPWVHHGMTYYCQNSDVSYIIPRQSGDVILGGTWQIDDWHPISRPETVKSIKERGIHAYPELLPPNKRENPDINDLDVVEECVGLRTTRKGGIRLETTSIDIGGKEFPIIHNYGHGGAGYQSSWGSAKRAIELLQASLER